MFLKCNRRIKDGKEHHYWNIVESKRVSGGRVVQRQVLYLGDECEAEMASPKVSPKGEAKPQQINDSQQEAWRKSIEIFADGSPRPEQVALFPCERAPEIDDESIVRIRLKDLRIERPRQWGACWLACLLYEQLELDRFWRERLPDSREGTPWSLVLQTLVAYRLIDPGSEWRLHRQWFERSAMADLLGADFSLAEKNTLYRCHDRLVAHKEALFAHLTEKWRDLFNARYEMLPGNTADKTTLRGFLKRIEQSYGKARRVWVMDRGIPTEEVLAEMRQSDPPVHYLVGTPRAHLARYEKELLREDWHSVRTGVEVKLLPSEGETYVLARSADRVLKEKKMRLRRLRILLKRLKGLREAKRPFKRDTLMMRLGEAKKEAGPKVWALVRVTVAPAGTAPGRATVSFRLDLSKYRQAYRREGRYLLRTNLDGRDPATFWRYYLQLTEIEQVFKEMKHDLAIRPLYHQKEERIEAHLFISFLAYCLWITLKHRLRVLAPGLTPAEVLAKMKGIEMLDVKLPTTDGRTVVLTRYTEPNKEQKLLLGRLELQLPPQPPPRIESKSETM